MTLSRETREYHASHLPERPAAAQPLQDGMSPVHRSDILLNPLSDRTLRGTITAAMALSQIALKKTSGTLLDYP